MTLNSTPQMEMCLERTEMIEAIQAESLKTVLSLSYKKII